MIRLAGRLTSVLSDGEPCCYCASQAVEEGIARIRFAALAAFLSLDAAFDLACESMRSHPERDASDPAPVL